MMRYIEHYCEGHTVITHDNLLIPIIKTLSILTPNLALKYRFQTGLKEKYFTPICIY